MNLLLAISSDKLETRNKYDSQRLLRSNVHGRTINIDNVMIARWQLAGLFFVRHAGEGVVQIS